MKTNFTRFAKNGLYVISSRPDTEYEFLLLRFRKTRVIDYEFELLACLRHHYHTALGPGVPDTSKDKIRLIHKKSIKTFYFPRRITIEDLPLYINWHTFPAFDRAIKGLPVKRKKRNKIAHLKVKERQ